MATLNRNLNLRVPLVELPTAPVRTKIVATIGRANSVAMITDLLNAGMSVVRCNFSHGTHDFHGEIIDNAREAMRRSGRSAAICLDTKGPEIRTGKVRDGNIQLVVGQKIDVTTDTSKEGDETCISLDYKALCTSVKPGGNILIADGLIALTIETIDVAANVCHCRVNNNATLGNTKNVHLPGAKVDLPAVSEKDVADIRFGMEKNVDMIAASFIRKAEDVKEIRAILGESHKHIQIISKIESTEGLENIDSILAVSDGIMVARGDLGVELPMEQIFIAQKMLISKCNVACKPVITATQMFESMITNPRPTRAECSDVANAVLDGTDAVMLSGETAGGAYPVEAVRIMRNVCLEAERVEQAEDYAGVFKMLITYEPISDAEITCAFAVRVAMDVGAKCIFCVTFDGGAALFLSKYRPFVPIVAMTGTRWAWAALHVRRAVYPLHVPSVSAPIDDLMRQGITFALANKLCEPGDPVVLFTPTEGAQFDVAGTQTLTVKVLQVAEEGGMSTPPRSLSPARR